MQADFITDVKSKLDATGRLEQVDVFDAHTATPSLAQLLAYDAVMTWSSDSFHDSNLLGDVLADYVDAGHGVVQSIFSFYVGAPAARLGGRWHTDGYEVFNVGDVLNDNVTLGTHDSAHPIFDGVNNLDTFFAFYLTGVVPAPCAQVVGRWSNNEPLAAWCPGQHGGRTVALNLYPPSADVVGINWLSTSDGAVLMANALTFAGSATAADNQPPTANAGPDQTIEATGPLGAAFTVNAVVADSDGGDALTIAWTGTGLVGNQPSFSGTLLPPVGVTAVSYTLTLTVSDNHGGVVSDEVVITVRDTTGPVLANVPAALVTVTATGASGAQVPYGPVTAVDAVDGTRVVTCSKSGLFPIGDTPVTCSSSDSRGNVSSQSFTVRVTDVTTPGLMWGDGEIRSGHLRYSLEFAVGERSFGQGALLELRVRDDRNARRADRFQGRATNFVAFSNDPAIHPNSSRIDTVLFSGTGEWNGRSGYKYQMSVVDRGDYWHSSLRVKLTITTATGAVVAVVEGTLANGGCTLTRAFHR